MVYYQALRRVSITKFTTATDGTNTADGSTGCLPATTTLTGSAIDLSTYRDFEIYALCPDVVTAMTADYQTSPDGSNWFNGEVSITNLDNNSQIVTPTETAIKYMRLRVTANTNTAVTALLFGVVGKS